ncbi:hypothetical protein BOTBODRAFT_28276 [Botryobasidium botryosum FD-172 SS1]|uniref:DNA damage-binding protein 1 n=1 Tax=Botryobasidium botryosum (strain FD-172 SS1) TaxID=930990 RepID=A0A067MVQ2_BOTB1|nr:hypothetical protein BOTBODRAFT_28276 [Botryobasidium botryosum FD-172 SS1]
MYAFRQEIVPPSGIEHVARLKLTPSTAKPQRSSDESRVLCNLVVARSNRLRIFEIVEEPAPLPSSSDVQARQRETTGEIKGTEAVEGEVQMDTQGDGFVNLGQVKSTSNLGSTTTPKTTRLYFVREHHLHGIVTGIERAQTLTTGEDGLDRVLISFKDAKVALMEWSDAQHDLVTVSIHTYERAPQVLSSNNPDYCSRLRMDPTFRCAALSLPNDALAILPFHQTQTLIDAIEQEPGVTRDLPYSPSFVLPFEEVDPKIRNVVDFVFLPGFNNPTIAVLFQSQQTWTARLNEFKDTVSLFIITLDLTTHTYPIITHVENLPYDSFALYPCPNTIGGVVVLSANGLFHVDQTAKTTGTPVNGWLGRVSDIQLAPQPFALDGAQLTLEGSHLVFVDDRTMLLFLPDGAVCPVDLMVDGRTVSSMAFGEPLARTTSASALCLVDEGYVFVGSTTGPSTLLKVSRHAVESKDLPSLPKESLEGMDMDLDEDLYGNTMFMDEPSAISGGNMLGETKSLLKLTISDSLHGHGSIADMTYVVNQEGDRPAPELVACTGSSLFGGFTRFQRSLPTHTKRKLPSIGGSRGLWSIPIRRVIKVDGMRLERPSSSQAQVDTIIVSTDTTPSPGLSRIACRAKSGDVQILARIPGLTIAAAAFFQQTCIAQVTTNSIRITDGDGSERQVLNVSEGNRTRAKITAASISDPYVLIHREDGNVSIFTGDAVKGRLSTRELVVLEQCSLASIFTDGSEVLRARSGHASAVQSRISAFPHVKSRGKSGSSDSVGRLETAIGQDRGTLWLMLYGQGGRFEIWSLPSLDVVFSSSELKLMPSILVDSVASTAAEDVDSDLDIECASLISIGQSRARPYLLVSTRSGLKAAYEVAPISIELEAQLASPGLAIQFVKVLSHIDSTRQSEDHSDLKRQTPQRSFVPFTTSVHDTSFSGAFFTGRHPLWVISTDKSGICIYPSSTSVVNAFSACSMFGSSSDFLVHSEDGPNLVSWIPDIYLGAPLVYKSVQAGRRYTSITYHHETQHIVAAASLKSSFILFDEEGRTAWTPDAPDVTNPLGECSCLELISPDTWTTIDGYEFAFNEFVNTVESVNLETQSTESGRKSFIAVATTIHRGEDLAVKGAVYVFEIVEVVPEPDSQKRRFKLRLNCRDDAKGPVTALCEMNGYLVSSMGQKVFVRAFDLDERLVGVAFLDVGVYVTTLRSLKNLLLIGDAVKSTWFVCFQEDPFKLVVMAKDYQPTCVSSTDFFIGQDGQFAIMASDEEGVLRLYDYDPTDQESSSSQKLICRAEFHTHSEHRAVLTIARREEVQHESGVKILQTSSSLICGTTDGAITIIIPLWEDTFKRLSLLQGQLVRNIQHVGGLNPKAFRSVRNDTVSRPLTKGILDGMLLESFLELRFDRQLEMTRQIGTERLLVMKDLGNMQATW